MTQVRRLLLACGALAVLYALVIALGDPHAWSGSDAGGKVATVKAMVDHRRGRPDVGYWAARADPDGRFHPLIYTRHVGDKWVQATSLPFVYLGVPLYRLWGTAGLLVLPAAGSVLAAVAARRLARAFGSTSGWAAFVLVGVASPALFYAGDFWEHAAAVGLALLAVALALEGGGAARAMAAGLCAGAAVVLRTEMALYGAALGAAVLLVADERRRWMSAPRRVVAVVGGAGLVVSANLMAERAVLGTAANTARTASAGSQAGAHIGERLSDGVLTTFGVFADQRVAAMALGVVALVGIAVSARRADLRLPASLVAGGLYLARFAQGLGFVPGALAAAPAAVTARPATPRARVVVLGALLALPLVWLFQWQGQLVPQWGGRYLLLTGALLLVVASLDWRAVAPAVALTVAVAGFGAAWHVDRTRDVAHAVRAVEAVPPDTVIVSGVAHLGREAGASYEHRRWLTAVDDLDGAFDVARAMGATRLAVVTVQPLRRPPAGYRPTGTRPVDFLGVRLTETSLERAD
jgi:hypothetical protein